jgi:hypothetical protein
MLVETGLVLAGAWPVDLRKHSVPLLVDDGTSVAAGGVSCTFTSLRSEYPADTYT